MNTVTKTAIITGPSNPPASGNPGYPPQRTLIFIEEISTNTKTGENTYQTNIYKW
jgi:hypothetical protein